MSDEGETGRNRTAASYHSLLCHLLFSGVDAYMTPKPAWIYTASLYIAERERQLSARLLCCQFARAAAVS